MNCCSDCRWCDITAIEAGVGIFECRRIPKHDNVCGRVTMTCQEARGNKEHCEHWELGGIKGWWQRIKKSIQRASADPCKDPRCKGCVHIDGLICPYPDECSAMQNE